MCVDLKNLDRGRGISFRCRLWLNIAGIVMVIVLGSWCLRLLPAAIDQALGIVEPAHLLRVEVVADEKSY